MARGTSGAPGGVAEVRRLAELGAVNFRLGGQANFFTYQAIGLGSSPTPRINGPAIRSLLEGIRAAAPNLKVLHTDNGDPAMMIAHPEAAMAAMRDLVRLASPGNLLSRSEEHTSELQSHHDLV